MANGLWFILRREEEMVRIRLMKTLSILLCVIGGVSLGYLIGWTIYFFVEYLPFRNEPPEVKLIHTVDGGLAVGILTFLFIMPGCTIAGFLLGNHFLNKRKVESL